MTRSIVDERGRSSLSRLIEPLDAKKFLAEHWERTPVVGVRGDAAYHDALNTLAALDSLISATQLHHPQLSVVDATREIKSETYTFGSGLVDASRVFDEYSRGATVIVQNMEALSPELARFCRSLEAELSTRFQTNIYATPANAQGFKVHYDSHDVFVMQVRGTKHWKLYNTPVELPYRRDEFRPNEVPVGEVTREFDLSPGDWVYIPRGVMHAAHCTGVASVHITLGVMSTTWTDFIAEALSQLGMNQPKLRQALPLGFARPDFDRSIARKTLTDMLALLSEGAEFDQTLDHFVADFIDTRHPVLDRHLSEMDAVHEVTAEALVRATPNLISTRARGESELMLAAYGREIRFPSILAPIVEAVLDAQTPRAIGALPGQSDLDRIGVVRRMVREGLASIES